MHVHETKSKGPSFSPFKCSDGVKFLHEVHLLKHAIYDPNVISTTKLALLDKWCQFYQWHTLAQSSSRAEHKILTQMTCGTHLGISTMSWIYQSSKPSMFHAKLLEIEEYPLGNWLLQANLSLLLESLHLLITCLVTEFPS